MKIHISNAMAIMMSLALAHHRAARKLQMRSLVKTRHPSKAAWSATNRNMIAARDADKTVTRLESAQRLLTPVFTSC